MDKEQDQKPINNNNSSDTSDENNEAKSWLVLSAR